MPDLFFKFVKQKSCNLLFLNYERPLIIFDTFFIGEASTNISRNTTPEGSNSATNSTENSSSHRWSNNRRSQLLKQHQGELNRVVFSDSRRLVIHVHQ